MENSDSWIQGYRQAVRHSTLTAAVAGSNPASPAYSSGCNICGTLAQAVEHLTFNQVVWGSNPQCLTKKVVPGEFESLGIFFSK